MAPHRTTPTATAHGGRPVTGLVRACHLQPTLAVVTVTTALAALADAATANAAAIPHEMILLDLYRALWALDSLTGQTTLYLKSYFVWWNDPPAHQCVQAAT